MQHQCPSCQERYLYESEQSVCVDEYGECMTCMVSHGKHFSAHHIIAKTQFRAELATQVRAPDDWRNNIAS